MYGVGEILGGSIVGSIRDKFSNRIAFLSAIVL